MAERNRRKQEKRPVREQNPARRTAVPAASSASGKTVPFRGLRFTIEFALLSVVLYAIIQVLPISFTKLINENTASALGMILNTLGFPVSIAGDTVSGSGLAFRIVPECTPIFTAGLFISFVAFYSAALGEKLIGFISGMVVLYLGNIARLVVTFVVSRYDRGLFEVVHVYLGQVFIIFLVILVCTAWVKWIDRRNSDRKRFKNGTAFLARFVLISSGLFLVWIHIHHWYIWLLDRFVLFVFSLFGHHFAFARHTAYYYETFSIVCFTSLVFSVRSIPPSMKTRTLAAGLGLLFFMHILHRIDNALMAYFKVTALLPLDLTLLVAGQYVLPVLLLIFLIYNCEDFGTRIGAGETNRHAV